MVAVGVWGLPRPLHSCPCSHPAPSSLPRLPARKNPLPTASRSQAAQQYASCSLAGSAPAGLQQQPSSCQHTATAAAGAAIASAAQGAWQAVAHLALCLHRAVRLPLSCTSETTGACTISACSADSGCLQVQSQETRRALRSVRVLMLAAPIIRTQSNTLLLLTKAMAKFVDVRPLLAACGDSRSPTARPLQCCVLPAAKAIIALCNAVQVGLYGHGVTVLG